MTLAMPSDLQAEEQLLAALMVQPQQFPEVRSVVDLGDFWSEPSRWMFGAIEACYDRDGARGTNQVTVAHELSLRGQLGDLGGNTRIGQMVTDLVVAEGASWYAGLVRKAAMSRRLIEASTRAVQHAMQAPEDPEAAIDAAIRALVDIQAREGRRESATMGEVLDGGLSARMAAHMDNPKAIRGFPVGILKLDEMIDGLQGGRVYVVAAETSTGKSLFAQNITLELVTNGYPVLYFSSEMGAESIGQRLIYLDAKIDRLRIRRRSSYTPNERMAVEDAATRWREYPIRLHDAGNLTIALLRSETRRWMAKDGTRCVVIDHMDHITAGTENRTREVADVMRGLKAMAVEFDIPIVAISHLSRSRDRGKLARLKDGSTKEQDADVVMFLCPMERDGSDWIEIGNDTANEAILARGWVVVAADVAKNRDGGTGRVLMRLDWWDGGGRFAALGGE